MANWSEIEKAADDAGINAGFFQFTMSAYENAATTVYEEKSAPEGDLEALCLSSLGSLLAYSDNKAACDFFSALGVRW